MRNWQKSGKYESIISTAASLDNLAGLYMLQDEMWHAPEGTKIYDAYMKYYAGKFPGHPYSEYFEILGNTVDPEGVIVAVNPSAEDVRAYLTEFYSTHE